MENIQTSELLSKLDQFRTNPNAIQREVYTLLEKAVAGKLLVVDPANPFSLLLESAAVMSADALNEGEAVTRRLYSQLVTNEDELFGHIADMEYIGVWGTPSTADFLFMLNVDEVKKLAVVVPGTGTKKLTIPRETEVRVGGASFTFAYPIDIIVTASDSISVIYDTSRMSPFMSLQSNVLEYKILPFNGINALLFKVPGMQYSVESRISPLSNSTGFIVRYPLTDQLYYCRVYHRLESASEWIELATTHSSNIYDRETPTAALKRADNTLTIRIPEVYFNTGQMGVDLRIDIFETKGDLSLALGEYPDTAVGRTFKDLDPEENGRYTAPLSLITQLAVTGDGTTKGGSPGLDFKELQARTVRNSTYKPVAVSEIDLVNDLKDSGYTVSTVIDNITNRTFQASRQMPYPTVGLSSSAIGTTVATLRLTSFILSAPSTIVKDDLTWSIMPNTLYKTQGRAFVIVADSEREWLTSMSPDELIATLNAGKYFFSPFLTTLDTAGNQFGYKNYIIDQPKIASKYFISDNDNVDYIAAITAIDTHKVDTGYVVNVAVTGQVGHETLPADKTGLQMAFKPAGGERRAYLEGVNGGRDNEGRLLFSFYIDTNFTIADGNELQVNNFVMSSSDTLRLPITPDTKFDFIHYVTELGLTEENKGGIQSLVGGGAAPMDAVAVSHETVNVRLFEVLDGLVNRSRTSIDAPAYSVHTVDVPLTYTEDVFQINPITGHLDLEQQSDGRWEPILIHAFGDEVLDSNGEVRLRHRAGERILDSNGEPVLVNSLQETYYIDQVLMDARYLFATEPGSVEYIRRVATTIGQWVSQDIDTMRQELLAGTDLFFSPKTNVGMLEVYSTKGEALTIDSAVSVTIDLYVDYNSYLNTAIRNALSVSVKEIVIAELALQRISTGSIHDSIRSRVGDNVIAIKVNSFNNTDIDAFTIQNVGQGCSLAKELARQPDGTLALVDDLTINFIRHE